MRFFMMRRAGYFLPHLRPEKQIGIESDKSAGNIIFVNRGLGVKNPGRFHL